MNPDKHPASQGLISANASINNPSLPLILLARSGCQLDLVLDTAGAVARHRLRLDGAAEIGQIGDEGGRGKAVRLRCERP